MKRTEERRRVVISGVGLITPIGTGREAFWDAVSQGVSGVRLIERFDTADYRTKIAAEVRDFDPKRHLTPQKIYASDRFSQFALVAAAEAVADSALQMDHEDRTRVGVLWGSSEGGINTREQQYESFFTKGPRAIDPMTLPKAMSVAPATHIAIEHGATGVNYSYTNTCSSGAVTVGEGCRLIRHGYADVIIAGSSEAPVTPGMLAGWCKLRALSTRNDDPAGAVRPFSKDRDGPVLGEGGAAVILESLEHAQARGARIRGEVAGYWANSDAHHLTYPHAAGEVAVMRGALEDAGAAPEEIGYINAHGTATEINDKGETAAIREVFGEHAHRLAVSSTKSMIGHLLGAAGTVELITTLLALEHQFLPPTINYAEPDPECDLDYVPNTGRPAELDMVLSNAFGFGGANTAVILRKHLS